MKESFIPVPTMWNKHPLYRKLKRENPLFALFLSELIYQTAQSRDPGRLAAFDGTPLGVEELADEHGGEVEDWAAFLEFGESIEVLSKGEDGVWTILIWKTFSRDPIAEEKDRARKQLEYQQKKHEKEMELVRSQLRAAAEPPETSPEEQDSPTFSESLQGSPEVSESLQNTPPIEVEVDIDPDLHEDLRSNTTACAETALATKPPDRTRGAPATWSASHFKKVWSADKAVDTIERDYGRLAEAIGLPTRMPAKLKMDLIRTLGTEPWKSHESDPLVHVVALKLALNLAYQAELSGVVKTEQAWPFALMKGAGYLEPARKVCALNRDAVELKQKLISPDEAERLYVPTTLEKQELAGANSS